MGSEEVKIWAVTKANAASNSFKLRSLTQGSYRLKPSSLPWVASNSNASSNFYPQVTKEDQQLQSLSFPSQARTIAPCDQKQLDRPINVLDFTDLEEGEIIDEAESDSKCMERNEADRYENSRNYSNIASTSGRVGIEDSLAEADCSDQEFLAKKLKLDPMLLDENIDTLNDRDVITDQPSQDSVTTVVEAKNSAVTIDPLGTQPMSTEEEMFDREKSNEKDSTSKLHSKRRKRRLQTEELSRENSKLVQELRHMGELCQKVVDENTAFLDELEKAFGRDAVSDLRDINSSFMNNQSNGDGESASHEDN